ncbi:uncharacterized protein LOC124462158 [Hypomesus transpacificus]|uniref:uncharacterized protein LOC124462158 n=1 Tax=Hypomesus transpacificus TaxID=137520 RepID=UPI001F07A93D|nr:uncharacterized protein LOC124462158 [Hypomesus transpacificus]
MSVSEIHRGTLRKYGGFVFKQWKERYMVLSADGVLLVCRDAASPPDQMVALQGGCEGIVEGREILDLPKLPTRGRRDCCFALILPLDKFLLLMTHTPEECSQWLNMLRKVRESVSMSRPCRRHLTRSPCITDRDPLPDHVTEKDPQTPPVSDTEAPSPGPSTGDATKKEKGKKSPRSKRNGSGRSSGCLRHGSSNDAKTVRAVYLLMGGAAASSAMGYLGACSSSNLETRAPDIPVTTNFSEIGSGGAYHTCSHTADSPHFHSFDFEAGDSDFDAFDCGGFAF